MNPELQRLIWLEVTPQRLLVTPLALLGAAVLLAQSMPPAGLASLALAAFVFITVFWGMRRCSGVIYEEALSGTWIIQRMSAMPAWPMTWGKLLGATLMPWYGGVFSLLLLFYFRRHEVLADTLYLSAIAVVAAVTLHAATLCVAIVGTHLAPLARRRLPIALTLILLLMVLPIVDVLQLPDVTQVASRNAEMQWFTHVLSMRSLNLFMLIAAAIWMLIAAYRAMCIEFQIRTRPLAWITFIAFWALVFTGFAVDAGQPSLPRAFFSNACLLACLFAYLAAFTMARDPLSYRRALQAFSEKRWRRAVEETPLVVSAVMLALACGVMCASLGSTPGVINERMDNCGLAGLALALWLLRDCALLVGLSFSGAAARAELSALLWIALLNFLLPGLFGLINLGAVAQLIRPQVFDSPASASVILLIQSGVALLFAAAQYHRRMRGALAGTTAH